MQISIKPSNHILLGILLLLALTSCGRDKHNHAPNMTGKQLFKHHCASCHMETGAGNFLKGTPANSGTELSVIQIMHKMVKGQNPDTRMPSFPNMPEEEASKIAAYLRQMPAVNSYPK